MVSTKELLRRTRLLTAAVQFQTTGQVRFSDLTAALGESLESKVALLSRKGKVLASTDRESAGALVDETTHRSILDHAETATVSHFRLSGEFEEKPFTLTIETLVIIPIYGGGQRLGTLLVNRSLDEAELVLAEYATTVAGIELLRAYQLEEGEENRRHLSAKLAASSLSYSETEALGQVFAHLGGNEGLVVASKIADQAGVTRSVIVNGLRKLESAGVITSRSLGMKGTYIKVLNSSFLRELSKLA
jgi:transcriptional pleiotropic repressor